MKNNLLLLFASLIILTFNAFSLKAQGCNPDVTPPVQSLKPNYVVYNSNAQTVVLEAKELINLVSDNCTTNDKLVHAFSNNKSNDKLTLDINDVYPKAVIVYTFDESGNYAFSPTAISFKACPPSIVCNNEVNIAIFPGRSVKLTVDMLLEGAFCRDRTYKIERQISTNNWEIITEINDNTPLNFQYRVTDNSNGNSCWGIIKIKTLDCSLVNQFKFTNSSLTAYCNSSINPESLSFPFSNSYKIKPQPTSNTYEVEVIPNCPTISVNYIDKIIQNDCSTNPIIKIERNWSATLPDGQNINGLQEINFSSSLISNTSILQDITLDCQGNYERIPGSDLPTTKVTGIPIVEACNQNTKIATTFDDNVFQVQDDNCAKVTKILRKWTILNWCSGETTVYNQVIKLICNRDKINPTPYCINSLTLALDPVNTPVTIYPSDLDKGSLDNCGPVTLAFDEEGKILSKTFTIADLGKTISVNLYVFDQAGNKDFCTSSVYISSQNPQNKTIALSGRILNVNMTPLADAHKEFAYELIEQSNRHSLTLCPINPSHSTNNYALCIDSTIKLNPGHLNIRQTSKKEPLNGVSTQDIVMIMKDLFNVQNLNVHQRIAADVDCNNSVDIFDLFDLRRLIFGITQNFICQDNVMFYTTDPIKPIQIKDYQINTLPKYDFDYVVIKKGDVSGNSLFKLKNDDIITRTAATPFIMDDIDMKENQSYDVWLRVDSKVKLYGLQIGQIFDNSKVLIENISSPFFPMNLNSTHVINERDWRALIISGSAESFIIENGFIKLRIQAKKDGNIKDAIIKDQYPFPILIIDENIELVQSEIIFKKSVGTYTPNALINEYNIIPNPSTTDITVSWTGSLDENLSFKLIDSKGSTVYQQDIKNGSTGLLITSSVFPQPGIYFLQIKNGKNLITKKIVRM